jgi:hypothetical protein
LLYRFRYMSRRRGDTYSDPGMKRRKNQHQGTRNVALICFALAISAASATQSFVQPVEADRLVSRTHQSNWFGLLGCGAIMLFVKRP